RPAWRAFANAFSRKLSCGSSASAMPISACGTTSIASGPSSAAISRILPISARVARFRQRVLEEAVVRLVGFGDADLGLRHHLDRERAEQRRDLADLAWVVRGEDQALHVFHSGKNVVGEPVVLQHFDL